MKAFTESLRYEYDLNENSFCIDGGCYEGNWSKIMSERYGCKIYAFEPIRGAAIGCKNVLAGYPNVHVFNAGLGYHDRMSGMRSCGDTSGVFSKTGDGQIVSVWRISSVVMDKQVDVLKLNIEGMEYGVLYGILEDGIINQFKNIQVQFHFNFKGAEESYNKLLGELEKTHEQEWDSAPVWCNWRLRE